MNAFYEHHKNSIEFGYRCFDRILLNGLIQPFQQPERVLGFFNTYRDGERVTRHCLNEIADQFHHWVANRSEKWDAPIVDAPEQQRRDEFVLPYLQKTKADHVAVILKAREPARFLVAIGGKQNNSPHLEFKQRWVIQYSFYLNDPHWGPCSFACVPTFLSRPESASISIIGWHCGCARRASLFGNARTPSCNAPTRNDYKHSPSLSPPKTYCAVGRSGWQLSPLSSPPSNDDRPAVNTDSSFPRSSFATI